MSPKGNDTDGRCGLVSIGVVLLEDVCFTVEVGFSVSHMLKLHPV